MTELYAVVRRNRSNAVRAELDRAGCRGYSRLPVLGRGKQRGLGHATLEGGHRGLDFLPKMLFHVVVEDAKAPEIVEAFVRGGQTGGFGDGRVFVMPGGEAWRISDGARAAEEAPAS